MRRSMKKTIWIMAAIAMTALSCSKQEGGITPPINGQEEVTYLKINSVTATEPTKGAIKDTKFPTDEEISIGLFVVGDGYTDAKYSNIKCTKPAGFDSFNYPQIELIESKTATVYAYYPYDSGVSDIAQIQVTSSINGNDCMWATPITDVGTSKPAIDLILNHALALVEITFNVFGPEATMTNVTVAGGDGAFSKAGSLDATDGTITPDTQLAASKTSPLSQDVELTLSDGKIIADCLLVPGKTGDDADSRQDFYIKCTYNGKTLSASLTGDNGVIIRQGTKSTVSLNIKDNKLEVVSVSVEEWADSNVSGSTATVGGHTVTFNCPEGLKYDLYTESGSTAIPGETTEAEKPAVIFSYDVNSLPGYRFVFNEAVSGCALTHDELSGIITVKGITQDVSVTLKYGTYIPYTANNRVVPAHTDVFGFPYDEARSTFSNGSGVVAIDGICTTIGTDAFRGIGTDNYNDSGTQLLGVIIPEGVTEIGTSAFDYCRQLVSVTFPSTLLSIGNNAFWGMGMRSSDDTGKPLVLPSSLSSIGQYAFENARIESVTLPAALKTVGTDAFKGCSITTLTIENGAVLGKKMFNSCFHLTTITCKSATPPNMKADDGLYAIANESGNTALTNIKNVYVPTSSVDAYKEAPGWSMYSDKISAIPE